MHQKVDNVINFVLYFIEFAKGRTISVNKFMAGCHGSNSHCVTVFFTFRIKRIFKQHAQLIYFLYFFGGRFAEGLRKLKSHFVSRRPRQWNLLVVAIEVTLGFLNF